MLGLAPSDIVAGTISRLTYPADHSTFERALSRVLRLQQARELTL